jgi:hypothetical protein
MESTTRRLQAAAVGTIARLDSLFHGYPTSCKPENQPEVGQN